MKKNTHINKLFLALSLSVFVLGCSDDDGASTSAGFAGVGSSYQEEEGTGEVFIPFRDGSVDESDITVSGSATEGEDYTVSYGTDGITVTVIDDDLSEQVETLQFVIASTTGAANRRHVLSIESDDPGFLAIDLVWPGAPDMDLYLYHFGSDNAWHEVDFSDPGHLELDWLAEDGGYGLVYNYWSGSSNPLNFTVTFNPSGGSNVKVNGADANLVSNASYTLANVNRFGTASANGPLRIVQTFTKTGLNFHDFSTIAVPPNGSRQASLEVNSTSLKTNN